MFEFARFGSGLASVATMKFWCPTIQVIVRMLCQVLAILTFFGPCWGQNLSSCREVFNPTPDRWNAVAGITSRSSGSDIFRYLTRAEHAPFSPVSDYRAAYIQVSEPHVAERLRAPRVERIDNALELKVDTRKFFDATDEQLDAQWRGPSLSLNTTDSKKYWGQTKNLKRGDVVRVTRKVGLSKDDLLEFFETGLVANRFLHVLNYDSRKLSEMLTHLHLNLSETLQLNSSLGGLAISTTFEVNQWGEMPDGKPLAAGAAAKSIMSSKDFVILMAFDVPVEALVVTNKNYDLPEHVKNRPEGYAIVQPYGAESEITIIGTIPKEWMINFSELQTAYNNQ